MNHLKKEKRNKIKFCECGCGKLVSHPTHKYLYGHKKECPLPLCKCGCGQKVKTIDRIYLWGHQSKGKNNPMYGKTHNEKVRKILSKKCGRKGKDHPMYGKHHSEETKQKISLSNIQWRKIAIKNTDIKFKKEEGVLCL